MIKALAIVCIFLLTILATNKAVCRSEKCRWGHHSDPMCNRTRVAFGNVLLVDLIFLVSYAEKVASKKIIRHVRGTCRRCRSAP